MFFIATYKDSDATYVLYNPQLRDNGVWPEGYFCIPRLDYGKNECRYNEGGLMTLNSLGTLERV